MYSYEDLDFEVVYSEPGLKLIRGTCRNCKRIFRTSSSGFESGVVTLRKKFRNHIAMGTRELCLSGMKEGEQNVGKS